MKTTAKEVLSATCLLVLSSLISVGAQQNQTVLDKDVRVVDFDELKYPSVALQARTQGVVVVQVKLDDHGKVTDAMPISGTEVLISDSLANVRKWRFRPNAQKAAVIVYNFRLASGMSKSGCSHFMLDAPNFVTVTAGCPPEVQW
jgi:TonB family protein